MENCTALLAQRRFFREAMAYDMTAFGCTHEEGALRNCATVTL